MPLSSPVAEYMTPRPVTVGAGATLLEAAILMDNLHVRHLPVVSMGRVVGVLAVESVVRAALAGAGLGSVRAGEAPGLMEAVWVGERVSVGEAARLMASRGVDALLVGGPGGLLGILTSRDVVRASVGELVGLPVHALAVDLPVVGLGETVGGAAGAMLERGVRHAVVVDEEGFLLGIHSVRDALSVIVRMGAEGLDARVGDALSPHVYTVDPGAGAEEAVEVMSDRDVGALPIVHAGRAHGAVTEWSIVSWAAGSWRGSG